MARILIAHPYEAARKCFVDALAPDGYTLVPCVDGSAVRREIALDLPDLVVTDMDLPGLDAFELVRALEDAAEGRAMPSVIVMSGLGKEAEMAGPEGSRFVWMGAPASSSDLRAVVRAKLRSAARAVLQGRILVVDDDLAIRGLLQDGLGMEGHQVIVAIDGVEGLERLAESPDLVLLDVSMPRLDGFSMLGRMRSDARYQDIPVIVMTAHARAAEDVARGLELGASDYLRKPIEWTELLARVQTQLRIREAHRLAVGKQRDQAVIELAGAAAHEINNPLTVVMGRLELALSRMDGSEPFYRDVEQAGNLTRRIADIVQKMGQVRRYQVRNYCGGINILDLDKASAPDGSPGGP